MLVRLRGLVFDADATLQRVVDALDLPGSYVAFIASGRRRIAGRVRKVAGPPTYRHGDR
ncbi:hypothetical protein [Luteimonas sp. TWI1416]|uniref:hypothetical protein n=1 Tax=unclassified Luteimonas TaxID=2629088 RepID=UPI003207A3F5